jgi:flagellin
MPLIVNTNVASLNAQRLLASNTNNLSKSLEKLSSGYRINRAADDAAGLQISETLRSQIRGTNQAINNSQDGNNVLSVAEGTLSTIQENLQRIRELAVQAANDTNGSSQRDAITQEIKARLKDVDRIASSTEFNGKKLLDGSQTAFKIQVGGNNNSTLDVIDIASGLGDVRSVSGLSIASTSIDVSSNGRALSFLGKIDTALSTVSSRRSTIGTFQNRLDSAINNLSIQLENFQSAESRIRNADIAKESADLSRNQILQQASAAILAQANQSSQLALNLIRG